MLQRGMDIADKTIPYLVRVGDVSREHGSVPMDLRSTHKSFLKKNNLMMMAINISLKSGKFVKGSDFTGIPGDDM